jgi:hypothetical protein
VLLGVVPDRVRQEETVDRVLTTMLPQEPDDVVVLHAVRLTPAGARYSEPPSSSETES